MAQEEPVDLSSEDLESAIEENSLVVVDFWADWCAPCKMIEPIMEDLTDEYGDKVFFGKLDVNDEREAAMEYQVSSIPAILFFKDGELANRVIGAVPKEKLEENLKDLLD